ncbi:hypothetical protein ACWF0M_28675 [Kribbella sp. NPDC055110]
MTEFVIFVVVMIVLSLISKARQGSKGRNGQPNARMQALIERIQAQQGGGNQPVQFQGQFTQAAGPGGPPPAPIPGQMQTGTAQGSQQAAAALQQLLQNGRQPRHAGERNSPGLAAQQPGTGTPYPPTGVYQPPAHRPPQNNLPTSKQDLDTRVRALMNAGNEVGAVRLLSDERELGILEAQRYARTLVAPQAAQQSADVRDEPDEDEGRYVGSAAFAESTFNVNDRDENVWASGWVDEPEPEDRSDIEELWQTVSNPQRPTPPS